MAACWLSRKQSAVRAGRPGTEFAIWPFELDLAVRREGGPMRCAMAGLLLMLGPLSAWANEGVYVGTWKTTNRKLDGAMTCAVKDLGDEKWQGRFFGIWQGVPFVYTVAFAGRPSDL